MDKLWTEMLTAQEIADCAAEVVAADDWKEKHCLQGDAVGKPRFSAMSLAKSFLAGIAWQKSRQTGVEQKTHDVMMGWEFRDPEDDVQ